MKYLDEYRDAAAARRLAAAIARTVTRPWNIMEVCGGQTHAIVRFGLDEMLPPEITLIHGPGCPVCVTPLEMIDKAVAIAVAAGGDVLLVRRHAAGARLGQGPVHGEVGRGRRADRLLAAGRRGAGPTAPRAAGGVLRRGLRDHRAGQRHGRGAGGQAGAGEFLRAGLPRAGAAGDAWPCSARRANRVQGFLAAGHVCTITGMDEYRPIARQFHVPIVVTGFEPLDILQGVLMCVEQLEAGRAEVENQYARSVRPEGNRPALRQIHEVFEPVDRGSGGASARFPPAGWPCARPIAGFDAERRFGVEGIMAAEPAECMAGEVLQGHRKPLRLPGLRHPLHARAAAGRADGLGRRGLRGLLSLPEEGIRDWELGIGTDVAVSPGPVRVRAS